MHHITCGAKLPRYSYICAVIMIRSSNVLLPHSVGALAQPFRYGRFLAIFEIVKAIEQIAKTQLQGQKYYSKQARRGPAAAIGSPLGGVPRGEEVLIFRPNIFV